VLDNV